MTSVVWLEEWTTRDPDTEPALACGALSSKARAQVQALSRARVMEVQELRGGLRVATRSHVGTVTVGEMVIHVAPKISARAIPTLMRYALGLDAISLYPAVATPLQQTSFLDLIALLVLEEIDAVLHAGLLQEYQARESRLAMPRGKLLFSLMARQPNHLRVEAPCRYQVRTADILVNQLALAVVSALRPLVAHRPLRAELHARERLLGEFCQFRHLTAELLAAAQAAMNRRSAYYEPIVRLAELVLGQFGPGFITGKRREALPGFLFDMNRLFEAFVARLCREYAPRELKVETQESLRGAYRFYQNPHRWTPPQLRPDIVVRARDGTPVIILDTKYKALGSDALSPGDLYQLTLYSLSFGSGIHVPARVIFPGSGTITPEPVLDFYGGGESPLARVSTMALDLHECADVLRRRDVVALTRIVRRLTTPLI